MKIIPRFTLLTLLLAGAAAARAAAPDAKTEPKTEAKAEAKPEPKPDAKAEAKPEAKAELVKLTQGTNGETILTLEPETQKRLGLVVANPAATQWLPEIRVTGHALDTAPLSDVLMEFGRALLTFDSSHQELERAKKLQRDENISARAFQEAEAAYRQNFAAVMAVRLKIETTWGKRLANLTGEIVVPPGTPRKMDPLLDELTRSAGLIRLDLSAGERFADPATARIETLAQHDQPLKAIFFDKLPSLDAQTQQQGLLFLQDQKNPRDFLARGEAVSATIQSSAAPVSGVVVPADAILRHAGKGWVFVQTAENSFVRRELALDRAVADGFFSADLSATNQVIINGAQTLLSAELSGGGFNTGQRD